MAIIGNGITSGGGQGITKNSFPVIKYSRGGSSISGTSAVLQCLNDKFIRAIHDNSSGYGRNGSYFIDISSDGITTSNILFTTDDITGQPSSHCKDSSRVIFKSDHYIQILKSFKASGSASDPYYTANVICIKNKNQSTKKYFWVGTDTTPDKSININEIYSLDNLIIMDSNSISNPDWSDGYMEAGYYLLSSNIANLYSKTSQSMLSGRDYLKKIKFKIDDSFRYKSISYMNFLGLFNNIYYFLIQLKDLKGSSYYIYSTTDLNGSNGNWANFHNINNIIVTDSYIYFLKDNGESSIYIYLLKTGTAEIDITEKSIDKNGSTTASTNSIICQTMGNSILINLDYISNQISIFSTGDGNLYVKRATTEDDEDDFLEYCQLLDNNKIIYRKKSNESNDKFGSNRVIVGNIDISNIDYTFGITNKKLSLNWVAPGISTCREVIRYDRPYPYNQLYYRKVKNIYFVKDIENLSFCDNKFSIFCNCSDDNKTGGGGSSIIGPCGFYLAESNDYILMLIESNNLYPYNVWLYYKK